MTQERANRLAMVVPLSGGFERTDHVVPGSPDVLGNPDVAVRVHRPKGWPARCKR